MVPPRMTMRKRRQLIALLGFGVIAAVVVRAQTQTPPQNQSSTVQFGTSYHNDVSPSLRDLPAVAPGGRNDGAALRLLAPNAMPPTILNFDGIPFTTIPPNTGGAVGLTQYVQVVNQSYQILDKATGVSIIGPVGVHSIWAGFGGACENNGNGTPVVLYDHLANRWLVGQLAGATDSCIAISTTADATGTYNRYGFHLGTNFFDSPHFGAWPDGYYMSANVFNSGGVAFLGPQAFAFDRAKMLSGMSAGFLTLGITGGASEPAFLPSDLDGAAPPAGTGNPFVSFPGSGNYNVRLFHADFVTPANTTFDLIGNPAAASFAQLCPGTRLCVPQLGTSQRLDGLGNRLMNRLAYRKFPDHDTIVGNYVVNSNGVAGIRWFELRNVTSGSVNVFQDSTYQPDVTWRWTGSAAMDRVGNLALGFSASSDKINPQIRYAGRLAGDPVNTLAQGEANLFDGTGSQTNSSAWGPYSSMTVDPVDDCTFWYTNEYLGSGSGGGNTRIGNFRFAECTAGPTPTASPSPSPGWDPTPTASPTPSPTHDGTPTATPSTPSPTPIVTPTASPTPSSSPAKALNISTRLRVETGDGVMIGGFIVTGTEPKKVVIRGVGPSLGSSGLTGVLADPTLELRGSDGALITQNDNWQDDSAQAAQLSKLGLALQSPQESGIVATLQPGAYTAVLAGKDQTAGIGLVEIYDVDPVVASQLANLSTRGSVQIAEGVLIGGFILGQGGNFDVIVRGIGPSLSQVGLSGVLADPTLELRDGDGALLVSNDNWQDDSVSAAQLTAHGLAPQDSLESGMFATLSPGAFTAILAGKNGGVGVGLIEVYDVSSNPTPAATPSPTPAPMPCSFPPTAFGQDFDGVIPPILPADWAAANAKGPPPLWATSNAGNPSPAADSSPNAVFVDDPDLISDKRLDSPNIDNLFGTNARLTFHHNFNLQDGFDGAVLEISIFGGAFQDVIEAGGSFVSGGYNSTISTGFGCPIFGRRAWSGNSAGFITTVVDLPHYTNYSNFQLRWRIGTDTSVSGEGWRIDTLSIKICPKPIPTPTPPEGTPAPTATPTATATAAPTPTPGGTPTPTPSGITVTNTNDSGAGSLRQALANAQDGDTITFAISLSAASTLTSKELTIAKNVTISGAGSLWGSFAQAKNGATIVFDPALNGLTISLTSNELVVDKDVTILGPGPDLLTVARTVGTPFRIFHVMPGHTVTIRGLSVTGGGTDGDGHGILNDRSMLVIDNCNVHHNWGTSAPNGGYGGGVYNLKGTLTISGSLINNNFAWRWSPFGDGYGGGVYSDGSLRIVNSTISQNMAASVGGGIVSGGSLEITNSTIHLNSVENMFGSSVGGIVNDGTGTINSSLISSNQTQVYHDGNPIGDVGGIENNGDLTLVNSTVIGNVTSGSSGGIRNRGMLTVISSVVSHNSGPEGGGGIDNWDNGVLDVRDSALVGNLAAGTGGAGILVRSGNASISNSSISQNNSFTDGGAVSNAGTLTIAHCTMSENTATRHGGCIYNPGSLQISSTILNAGNSGGTLFNSGSAVSIGYNLGSDDGAGVLIAMGDQINTDPLIDGLQNNGGPTPTQALLPGSPAINAGDPNFTPPPLYDQRGPGFDRVSDGRIDAGSFEVQAVK